MGMKAAIGEEIWEGKWRAWMELRLRAMREARVVLPRSMLRGGRVVSMWV